MSAKLTEQEVLDYLVVDELAGQDDFINEKSRRLFMSALEPYSCPVPFAYLRRATGLSDGNISGHLAKLENAGLVTIGKRFEGRRPRTSVSLTDEGRAAIEDHWRNIERFLERRRKRLGKRSEAARSAGGSL